jgi:hypothetical protein
MSSIPSSHVRPLPLGYDITIPIYKDDDIVQKKIFSTNAVVRQTGGADQNRYFDKLKAKYLSKKSSNIVCGKEETIGAKKIEYGRFPFPTIEYTTTKIF